VFGWFEQEVAMIDRRQLITVSGLLGALTPPGDARTLAGDAAYGAGQSLSPQAAQDIVSALKDIRTAIAVGPGVTEIMPVRIKQMDYLKAQSKFPDFIDVGIDVWYAVYDWHVRLQQQLVLGRDAVGRYTLMLGFTALVLRPDAVANFISTPYDSR
jgi:hypothetical protein